MIEDIDGNTIKLQYGNIELSIDQGGWSTNYNVDVTWTVDYHHPDIEVYKYETCSSLEEALGWYKEQEKRVKETSIEILKKSSNN